jgi:hypothetical protein
MEEKFLLKLTQLKCSQEILEVKEITLVEAATIMKVGQEKKMTIIVVVEDITVVKKKVLEATIMVVMTTEEMKTIMTLVTEVVEAITEDMMMTSEVVVEISKTKIIMVVVEADTTALEGIMMTFLPEIVATIEDQDLVKELIVITKNYKFKEEIRKYLVLQEANNILFLLDKVAKYLLEICLLVLLKISLGTHSKNSAKYLNLK